MGRCKRVCDLCGAEKTEFTVTSKHLGLLLKDLKEFVTETDHITKHICTECFLKIFRKPEGNQTIEQDAGENRIEGGVVSVSGSVSRYRPFNNCDELIEYWYDYTGVINCSPKLFMPTIWIKHKRYGTENLIIAFDNDNESIGGSCVFVQDMWVDMQELFDNFTFLDGSLCGMEK